MTKQQQLQKLAEEAILRLKQLPQPVVRVCGPLTSGPFEYEKNYQRFLKAEKSLKDRGYNVFDYFSNNDDEVTIKSLDLPWSEIMEYYHQPILASGIIAEAFFMLHWQESNGAVWEHKYSVKNGLKIRDLPEEWLE